MKSKPGYVYIDGQGRASPLAAAHPETAQTLLWEALALSRGPTLVNGITTGNMWAVDVGLAAPRPGPGRISRVAGNDGTRHLPNGHFL